MSSDWLELNEQFGVLHVGKDPSACGTGAKVDERLQNGVE